MWGTNVSGMASMGAYGHGIKAGYVALGTVS